MFIFGDGVNRKVERTGNETFRACFNNHCPEEANTIDVGG